MAPSVVTQQIDTASHSDSSGTASRRPLAGKRVAMVTFSSYPFDPRPRRAIEALISQGMTVDLICLGSKNAPRRESLKGIEVLRVAVNKEDRGGKFKYGYRYASFILFSSLIFALHSLTRGYDLVYVHNMPDILVLSGLIPQLLGSKVVLDMHDPMPELMTTIFNADAQSRSVKLLKRLEKWSLRRANLVVTVNIACKRIFSSRSCPAEKIAVVMNSPDGQIFPFRAAVPQAPTAEFQNKPFVILYHGSLLERNGLDVAVDALAQVLATIPSAELRILGSKTSFLEQVLEAAQNKGIQKAIRYLGPKSHEDVVKEIENCDLGVIPNRRNAFTDINTPTRIFEYLAVGKPVIAPSTRGIQDYFEEGSLLFFEAGNAGELAQQIQYVYSHPRESLEVVRKGQQVYLEHTWECEKQTLLDRVSEILNTH